MFQHLQRALKRLYNGIGNCGPQFSTKFDVVERFEKEATQKRISISSKSSDLGQKLVSN